MENKHDLVGPVICGGPTYTGSNLCLTCVLHEQLINFSVITKKIIFQWEVMSKRICGDFVNLKVEPIQYFGDVQKR